ncbi:MAG: 4-hydroxybutyrate CoA-transferase [Archaeoglobaceae archaeon]|nr:4-hydroxybutyrate CoA-transferase [Archaeoglobaceae archaeon]MDW8117550.1 acetyl-CoA hydrolase/transferase C-terminal domain-containing protein [Archaeoglobaceae archaeon]
MNVRAEYENKVISAEEAAKIVKSNNIIALGGSMSFAHAIDAHLARRKSELQEVVVSTFIDVLPYEFLKEDPQCDVFKWMSGFVHLGCRAFSKEIGATIYLPNLYCDVPRITREVHGGKIDVSYLVTTQMDEHGYFNFGVTCSHMRALAESSKKVVLVVKKDMPWVNGGYDETIHISEVDYIVEDEMPTPCLPFTLPSSEQDEQIAENIIEAKLIENGSTLQVGIGSMPDSVVKLLKEFDFKDLGLHTEMIGDGTMELMEEGIITNTQKKIDRGKSVFTFTIGTRKLYDFIDRNPSVATYPVDYTNDPFIISQQPKMFSLNQAAQIDLMGQVNSEQIGLLTPTCKLFQISGTGGQLDFVTGCLFSKDRKGKSVLALYSTYNGSSTILPTLPEGSAVTVPRTMVQYVATEWGVAYLRGYPIRERATALINIAHPDHRDWLIKEAQRVGIYPHNYTPPAGKPENVLVKRD